MLKPEAGQVIQIFAISLSATAAGSASVSISLTDGVSSLALADPVTVGAGSTVVLMSPLKGVSSPPMLLTAGAYLIAQSSIADGSTALLGYHIISER